MQFTPNVHRVSMTVGVVRAVHSDGSVDIAIEDEGGADLLEDVGAIGSVVVDEQALVFTSDLRSWAVQGSAGGLSAGSGAGSSGANAPAPVARPTMWARDMTTRTALAHTLLDLTATEIIVPVEPATSYLFMVEGLFNPIGAGGAFVYNQDVSLHIMATGVGAIRSAAATVASGSTVPITTTWVSQANSGDMKFHVAARIEGAAPAGGCFLDAARIAVFRV